MGPSMRLAALSMISAAALFPSATATGAPPALVPAPPDVASVVARLQLPGVAPSLRALALLAGVEPAVHGEVFPATALALPARLRGPVGRILASLELAQGEVRRAIRLSPARAADALADLDRAGRAAATADADEARRLGEVLEARYGDRVDEERLLGAAIEIAETIDAVLPDLIAAPAVAGEGRAACDLLDASPALCVGGEGPNIYTAPAWVQIDLGGNDTYQGAAAGSSVLPPASLLLDVAGDDLYESVLSSPGATPLQGAGLLGIGMLVDAAGNDRYSMRDDPAVPVAETILTGQAHASFGVGVLDDRSGNDIYEMAVTGERSHARIQGQAYASFAGFSLLADHGGNDRYVVSGRPAAAAFDGRLSPGDATVAAQGFGLLGGTAILADMSGSDSITLEAVASPVGPEQPQFPATGDALVQGLGYAFYGADALLSLGPGPSVVTASAESTAPRAGDTRVEAIGWGSFGGAGAVHDAGGDDTYRATAVTGAISRQECACRASSDARAGAATVQAVGVGVLGGAGLLEETGGNDRYELRAASTAEARAVDSSEDALGAVALAAAGDAISSGIAAGFLGGTGFLEDAAGSDLYDAVSASGAGSEASAAVEDALVVTASSAGDASSFAQAHGEAGGLGSLRDLGGTDLYSAVARSEAIASPDGVAETGAEVTSIQGSTFGAIDGVGEAPAAAALLDQGGGSPDTFSSSPADPACLGTRGQSTWRDCGQGIAGGHNA